MNVRLYISGVKLKSFAISAFEQARIDDAITSIRRDETRQNQEAQELREVENLNYSALWPEDQYELGNYDSSLARGARATRVDGRRAFRWEGRIARQPPRQDREFTPRGHDEY